MTNEGSGASRWDGEETTDGTARSDLDAEETTGAGWSGGALGARSRRAPYLRLLAYYAVVAGIATLLILNVPVAQQAFVSDIVLPITSDAERIFSGAAGGAASGVGVAPDASQAPAGAEGGAAEDGTAAQDPSAVEGRALGLGGTLDRSITVALIVLGSLVLVAPVAWIYMFTRRIQYDPSLVHSIIILPVVVAAVVVIVKNSLALAFSLAGIVAAVRFRTTIKDLKDAVHIFLAIGIGLAAGVQALDVAWVMSLSFSLVILTLWKFDTGGIYTGGPGRKEILSIGDPRLLVARSREERNRIRERVGAAGEGMKTDGILLVHAAEPDVARRAIEVSLHGRAKEWTFAPPEEGRDGCSVLPVLVRLKSKKGDPLKVLGELEERFHRQVQAAEYVPYKTGKDE